MERLDFTAEFYLRHSISPSGLSYNPVVPKKNDSTPRQFKVGDRVKVSLPLGHIVEATIRAVIEHTDGLKLQVDYGIDQTALVSVRQVLQ